MRHFCTVFDKNFLTRGLALYFSLVEHSSDFSLWILCMDSESYSLLEKLNLPNIKLLRLRDVEDEDLLRIKTDRTTQEYCWMMSSSLPLFLLEKVGLYIITYLDADMSFFRNPQEIYDEFGSNSIMITPHWYPTENDPKKKQSGIYNVGMMIFRNDPNGLACLRWWKAKCIKWCYARYEDGKFGDQLYLNDWPERFKGVCVLKNQGADIASWNIRGYEILEKNNGLWLKVKNSGKEFPVTFYHYHGLKFFLTRSRKIRPYPVTVLHKKIYAQYLQGLEKGYSMIWAIDPSWNFGLAPKLDILRRIKQTIFHE